MSLHNLPKFFNKTITLIYNNHNQHFICSAVQTLNNKTYVTSSCEKRKINLKVIDIGKVKYYNINSLFKNKLNYLNNFIKRYYSNNMKPRVYITRPDVAPVGINLLKEECDVTMWTEPVPVPRDELLKNVVGIEGIYCALTEKIDVELLDHAGPNLKVISTISVGYEHIDVKECKKRGIRIGYTPDVLTDATAELTVALLLATSRRLFEASREAYNGGWKAWAPSWMCGQGLKNSVVGIFGFGRIGQEIAKRIKPFKPAKILYTNRSDKSAEAKEVDAENVSFDNLLKNSDFIIISCSLSPETKLLFSHDAFGKMKNNAIIVNTSRGGVIDQDALYNALKSGRIKAAGLDVTTPEPIPLDNPLLTLNNCIILPHIGSADIDTRIEMSRITACNIIAGLKGNEMISEIK